jgi:hypothetical protein
MSSVAIVPLVKTVSGEFSAAAVRTQLEASLGKHFSSTQLLRERASPLAVATGIANIDQLTGGLPRGALSEFAGPGSSGRTGAMLSVLAEATRREEICALVDASDSFDPASAAAAGVNLERLLWVRCSERASFRAVASGRPAPPVGRPGFAFSRVLEQGLKVTDLLLQGGGFGMVVVDLGDIPSESVRRIPLTSWFRFRRAVEPTATVLLLIAQEACAKTCASLVLNLRPRSLCTSDTCETREQAIGAEKKKDVPCDSPPLVSAVDVPESVVESRAVSHTHLLRGAYFWAEVVRSSMQRKPPRSVGKQFELRSSL